MTRDELVASALVVSFAGLVTVHALLVAGLAGRRPRWHALAAILVLPLAPWWGYRAGMRVRAGLWLAGAALYGCLYVLASR